MLEIDEDAVRYRYVALRVTGYGLRGGGSIGRTAAKNLATRQLVTTAPDYFIATKASTALHCTAISRELLYVYVLLSLI